MEPIINKVAESGIITLDLTEFLPQEEEIKIFDLKPFLFKEMILKEKDYRVSLQVFDWSSYQNKNIALLCSVDAIIPVWAYMLAATYLQPIAKTVYFGSIEELKKHLMMQNFLSINTQEFIDQRVVIKGCGDIHISEYAYVAITTLLRPIVKSIMYGEPCSTVPIFKRK